jgi:hypothetical protein
MPTSVGLAHLFGTSQGPITPIVLTSLETLDLLVAKHLEVFSTVMEEGAVWECPSESAGAPRR